MSTLLCIDPSFTATGWVVVELGGEGRIVDVGVVRTKPAKSSARFSAAQDGAWRGSAIRRAITAAIAHHAPLLVAQEGSAGSKSAKSAAGLARAQQACVDAVETALGAMPLILTPQAVKQASCGGNLAASKGDLEDAACRRWPALKSLVVAVQPKGAREHVYDAACVALTIWTLPEVVGLRRVVEVR